MNFRLYFANGKWHTAFPCESYSTGYLFYLGVASDGAGDGSAVTGHHRSINQGPCKLWHTSHVFLLEGSWFVLQAYIEKGERTCKLI